MCRRAGRLYGTRNDDKDAAKPIVVETGRGTELRRERMCRNMEGGRQRP